MESEGHQLIAMKDTSARMEQEFLDKLEAMELEGRQPAAEKGLLELPADLSKVMGASTNIYDLPDDLLCSIMEPLSQADLLSTVKCHPNLLRATVKLLKKRFFTVKCLSEKVRFFENWTFVEFAREEAELLLFGASVSELEYDLQADILSDMRVDRLIFEGDQKDAHKCAELIEKWKPSNVAFPKWDVEAFSSNPDLARVLKDVRVLKFRKLPVEWLDHVPEWKFTALTCWVGSGGQDVTSQIQTLGQKLYDQWSSFERGLLDISIYLDSELGLLQIGSKELKNGGGASRRAGDFELRWSRERHLFSMTSLLPRSPDSSLCDDFYYDHDDFVPDSFDDSHQIPFEFCYVPHPDEDEDWKEEFGRYDDY